jgi:hypothetical protein
VIRFARSRLVVVAMAILACGVNSGGFGHYAEVQTVRMLSGRGAGVYLWRWCKPRVFEKIYTGPGAASRVRRLGGVALRSGVGKLSFQDPGGHADKLHSHDDDGSRPRCGDGCGAVRLRRDHVDSIFQFEIKLWNSIGCHNRVVSC